MLKRQRLTSINQLLESELNPLYKFQLKSEWEIFLNPVRSPSKRAPKRPTKTQNATNGEGFCSDLWWKYSQLKVSERDRVEEERKRERNRSLSKWVLLVLLNNNNNNKKINLNNSNSKKINWIIINANW